MEVVVALSNDPLEREHFSRGAEVDIALASFQSGLEKLDFTSADTLTIAEHNGGNRVAVDVISDLDDNLRETKVALREQAETMLEIIARFEAQLAERITVAEQRLAALRTDGYMLSEHE